MKYQVRFNRRHTIKGATYCYGQEVNIPAEQAVELAGLGVLVIMGEAAHDRDAPTSVDLSPDKMLDKFKTIRKDYHPRNRK